MKSILKTTDLTKAFGGRVSPFMRAAKAVGLPSKPSPTVRAVNAVSLDILEGEVLGMVGESGCGKSTFGRMAAGILEPSSGDILFEGKPLSRQGAGSVHLGAQMVFQNPYASLNPRLRIDKLIGEAAVYHGLVSKADMKTYVGDLLTQVGLDASYASRYPHQFSGGQRQRIAIARALALKPRFMICDEAVSALDVSVQAQILNLFMDLRESRNLTYLFISHNLSVVEYIADRVAIMYLGRLVELAPAKRLFSMPNHPYTAALIADAPRMDASPATHKPIQGELPSPLNPPPGCAFHPRCPKAMNRCRTETPAMVQIAPMHFSACHLNEQ